MSRQKALLIGVAAFVVVAVLSMVLKVDLSRFGLLFLMAGGVIVGVGLWLATRHRKT